MWYTKRFQLQESAQLFHFVPSMDTKRYLTLEAHFLRHQQDTQRVALHDRLEMDIIDLFVPLPSGNTTTTAVYTSAAAAAGADFDFDRHASARETAHEALSSASHSPSTVKTPSMITGHTSPATDSEHAVHSNIHRSGVKNHRTTLQAELHSARRKAR